MADSLPQNVAGVRLIARADDAGSTRGATDAVFRTATQGIIRNAGIMMCCPAAEYAAERLRSLGDEICLGLHATVTSEWTGLRWGPMLPADSVPLLVEKDGTFVQSPRVIHGRGEHEKAKQQIVREISAQLDRARALGLNVRYIDNHMGFSWLPGVGDALSELAAREGLVADLGTKFGSLAGTKSENVWERFRSGLEGVGPGVYVSIFHPCDADDASAGMVLPNGTSPVTERMEEAAMLCANETAEWMRAHRIELVRYTDVML